MTRISCLEEIDDPLVLDASVVVNLNATGFADRVLDAIPSGVFIPDPVVRELQRGIKMGHKDATDLDALLAQGLAETLKVPTSAQSEYISLVSGSSMGSLGDGEAATIASAFAMRAWAGIDERKARRICRDRYKGVKVASTVDILAHPDVLDALSEDEFSSALLAALEVANMQVQRQHMDWVVARIDPDRISNCLSRPRSVRNSIHTNLGKSHQGVG